MQEEDRRKRDEEQKEDWKKSAVCEFVIT